MYQLTHTVEPGSTLGHVRSSRGPASVMFDKHVDHSVVGVELLEVSL